MVMTIGLLLVMMVLVKTRRQKIILRTSGLISDHPLNLNKELVQKMRKKVNIIWILLFGELEIWAQ